MSQKVDYIITGFISHLKQFVKRGVRKKTDTSFTTQLILVLFLGRLSGFPHNLVSYHNILLHYILFSWNVQLKEL